MSLSTFNIDQFIQQTTDSYIRKSNYATLRQHCLEITAIPPIIQDITTVLTQHLVTDKEASSLQLTAAAIKKQIQEDIREHESDSQQENTDLKLISELGITIGQLQERMRHNANDLRKYDTQEHHLLGLIRAIEQQQITHQRTHTNTSHNHSHSDATHGHQHDHTHGDAAHSHQHDHAHADAAHSHQHAHADAAHSHQHDHTHADAAHDHQHDHAHSAAAHHHDHVHENLLRQKSELSAQLSTVQYNMNQTATQQRQMQVRINEATQQLNVDLPLRKRARETRESARTNRNLAHTTQLPIEQQLSTNNYQSLQASISTAHKKLDQKCRELMQQASEESYQIYMEQLEQFLKSQTSLNIQENEALKKIIALMKEYFETEDRELSEKEKLHKASQYQKQIIQTIKQTETRIVSLNDSNPALLAQNQQLEQENIVLGQTIEARTTYRNKLLITSGLGFLLSGGAVGGAFLALYMLPIVASMAPVLFVPASVIAITTLGVFIAALAYTIKNSIDANQLAQNQTTIATNIETMQSQNNELQTLEQSTLPSLKQQLAESEHTIAVLNKNIEGLHAKAELLLGNAHKVNIVHSNPHAFFSDNSAPPPPYTPTAIEPTAPLLDEDEDHPKENLYASGII